MNLDTKKQRMAQFISYLPLAPPSDSWFIHFTPQIKTLKCSKLSTLDSNTTAPSLGGSLPLNLPSCSCGLTLNSHVSQTAPTMKHSMMLGFQLLAGLNPPPLTEGEVGVGVPWESAGGPPWAAFGPRQREAGLWESFIAPPPQTLLHSSAKC